MRNRIDGEVKRLKRKYGTSDPFELIKALNINLMIRHGLGSLKGFYYTTHRQRYIVINGDLEDRDRLMVAAHELGHDRLHRDMAKVSPLKDFVLYDMTSRAEHQANVFASELLIEDSSVEECITAEMDYLTLCSVLGFNPQLVTFKLYGMMQRGYSINLPQAPDSRFLR
ncbi:MAG: ImmA/IrrE family metallo-endopeptidase [Oscillospiraceae bacterium]